LSDVEKITGKCALRGEVLLPGDKSISHRAAILLCLSDGQAKVRNFSQSEDVWSTVAVLQALGGQFERAGNGIIVRGFGARGPVQPNAPLDAQNSGTTMRLVAGVLAGWPIKTRLIGDESLQQRPMKRIIEPLSSMGAVISGTQKGTAPLEIQGGNLSAIEWQLPVASAQVKSCIMLAGLRARGRTIVTESPVSRDHTERMMKYLGINLDEKYNDNRHTVALEGFQRLQPHDISVPGDFSSAAFLISCALLCEGSLIKIKNVGVNPTRTGFFKILKSMGARVELENKREVCGEPVSDIVARYSKLKAITVGREQIPSLIDEIPALAVLATQAIGTTRITGAGELRVKESDRLKTITVELTKMGAKIEELQDGLVIEGPVSLKGATVSSQSDHRIAMALAVAGLIADGETIIEKPECVSISFPNFFDTLSFFKK